ncbi:MAG: hypothetical protein ACK56Q_11020 [Pirellulaceae bacterium]|jgi:hypothetical protein
MQERQAKKATQTQRLPIWEVFRSTQRLRAILGLERSNTAGQP